MSQFLESIPKRTAEVKIGPVRVISVNVSHKWALAFLLCANLGGTRGTFSSPVFQGRGGVFIFP